MIRTIETIDCVTKRVMAINFYTVTDKEKQGIFQSHSINYLSSREYYKDYPGEKIGLEKVKE